jgi:hypothetical protein
MKRGDLVLVTYCGQVKRAMVLIASDNQRSLMLGFHGALRACKGSMLIGAMPILMDEDGAYRDLISDELVEIEPARFDA